MNIGIQPERSALVRVVPAAAITSGRQPKRSLLSVFKTCPAQNEEFSANKAKGGNPEILPAKPDLGAVPNLDFTRATVAHAIQKEQWPVKTLNSDKTRRGRLNASRIPFLV